MRVLTREHQFLVNKQFFFVLVDKGFHSLYLEAQRHKAT